MKKKESITSRIIYFFKGACCKWVPLSSTLLIMSKWLPGHCDFINATRAPAPVTLSGCMHVWQSLGVLVVHMPYVCAYCMQPVSYKVYIIQIGIPWNKKYIKMLVLITNYVLNYHFNIDLYFSTRKYDMNRWTTGFYNHKMYNDSKKNMTWISKTFIGVLKAIIGSKLIKY